MEFDPAIAAQVSFRRAQESGELGVDLDKAIAAEAIFSANAGSEATAAYFTLQEIGQRHPEATALQEFLIYITWQQVTEDTIPAHFQRGADLCERYLSRLEEGHDTKQVKQIRELRRSFRAGLGQDEDDEARYDEDSRKGGE